MPRLAACDRLLGLKSESLVFQVYYIASEFDIKLKRIEDWIVARRPRWYRPFTWLVLAWCMLRFDIFHFFCDRGITLSGGRMGINARELAVLKAAGKRIYTYTYGADVRTRERTLALGEFNFCMHCPEPGKFCVCDGAAGAANIRTIELYATRMLAMGDMLAYVPSAENLHFWPLDLGRISCAEPRAGAGAVLRVAHAPNHPHFKGTQYLESTVAQLQAEGVAIELVRIPERSQQRGATAVPRSGPGCRAVHRRLSRLHRAGGHGGGRPVISYLRGPEMMIDPASCPILNAGPHTLYQVLKDLRTGRHDLAALGRRGRSYVERYYSEAAVAARLGRLYLRTASLPARWKEHIEARVAVLEAALPAAPVPERAAT